MPQVVLLLIVTAVLMAVLFLRSGGRGGSAQLAALARPVGLAIATVLLAILAMRNWYAALALAPMLLPLVARWQALRQRLRAARGPAPGQQSDVKTRFLRMGLDHDTGMLFGEVLEGRFAGRSLSELNLQELVTLWREIRPLDEQSTAVLETYLDRTHGESWRDHAAEGEAERRRGGDADARSGHMSREEALHILGLSSESTADEIKAAHRRLMQKLHPDQGGSTYLAAKINEAKRVLLGH